VEFSTLQHHRPALLSISRFKLEQTALPEEILSIELAASQLMSWQPVIDTLFTSGRRPRQAPDELIDRFRARLRLARLLLGRNELAGDPLRRGAGDPNRPPFQEAGPLVEADRAPYMASPQVVSKSRSLESF
jgi:hypothetical protein